MTCTCTPCEECNGTGTVWFSFSGRYLGNNRCDDLDDLQSCESCHGSGIDEMCDECREKEEEAEWEEQERMYPTGLTPKQREEVEEIINQKRP